MSFSWYRAITIDHTKCGATNSTNFPVLVSGTYSYLATIANGGLITDANGYDIGFYLDQYGGTKLDWETTLYTAATGQVIYWVRVPTVSHNIDTVIYMLYVNSSVTTDQSNPTGVWDSNYKSVYHSESASGAGLNDSTTNANTCTNNSSVTSSSGEVGNAWDFAAGSYMSSSSSVVPASGTAFTIAMWIKTTQNTQAGLFTWRTVASTGIYFLTNITTNKLHIGDNSSSLQGTITINDGSWHHVAAVYAGGGANNTSLYVDGVLDINASKSFTWGVLGGIRMGTLHDAGFDYSGSEDEVQLSDTARSADWLLSEYNNQGSPSSFYALGSQLAVSATPDPIAWAQQSELPRLARIEVVGY